MLYNSWDLNESSGGSIATGLGDTIEEETRNEEEIFVQPDIFVSCLGLTLINTPPGMSRQTLRSQRLNLTVSSLTEFPLGWFLSCWLLQQQLSPAKGMGFIQTFTTMHNSLSLFVSPTRLGQTGLVNTAPSSFLCHDRVGPYCKSN